MPEHYAKTQILGAISGYKGRMPVPTEKGFMRLSIGVERKAKQGGMSTSYIPVIFFAPLSEKVADEYNHGDEVVIDADVRMRQDDNSRWQVQIIGAKIKPVELASAPPDDDGITF